VISVGNGIGQDGLEPRGQTPATSLPTEYPIAPLARTRMRQPASLAIGVEKDRAEPVEVPTNGELNIEHHPAGLYRSNLDLLFLFSPISSLW